MRHPLVDGGSYRFEVRARNGGGWSATTRTDTVTLPVDTKGRVALSTTTPRVGDDLTATLTDPDNPTDVGFTWAFFLPAGVSGANGADPPPSAVQSEPLRVSTVHLGLQIRARVSYTDDYGRQQAQSPKTSAVVGPPWAPRTFTATAGDGQVALAWEVPLKIGGSAITSYQYRYKKTSGSWPENWTSAGTATSATVTDLTNGTPYSFAVRAVNGYGDGTVASAAATPTEVCSPSSFTASPGNEQVSLSWNAPSGSTCATVTGYSYRYKAAGGSWSDWSSPSTATTATVPSLTNGQSYSFEVRTVAGARTSRAVSASATPEAPSDTKGRVSLSTTAPQVGDDLTATLTDPDNPTDVRFSWSYHSASGVSGANGADPPPSAALSSTLQVRAVLLGVRILATVSYTDDHGGQQARSDTTAAVVGPPSAPRNLDAVAGNGQVVLSWDAPLKLGGAVLTRYESRYKKTAGDSWSSWTSAGTATSQTVSSLTNGTAYSFAVRAVNSYGDGTAASAEATPQPPVCSPSSFTASPGNQQVSLSWNAPSGSSCATVTGYDYRYKASGGSWSSWTSAGTATSQTVTGLTNGTAYSFEGRAVAGPRTSRAVSASATPVQPDTPGRISLSPNPPQAGGQMTATLSDADGSIRRVSWSWAYFGATGASEETADEAVTGSTTATTATRKIPISRTKVGYSIRVYASYTDGYGSGRRAQSDQSLPITAPPPVVCSLSSLSASPGNGQVSLSWSAPSGSNCASVTRYEYRYKSSSGSWSSWSSTGTATSKTVTSLTNGTAYSFEVHAVTGQGTSAAVSASATPVKPNTSGRVSLSPTTPQAGSSITATLSDPDTPITGVSWSLHSRTPSGAEGQSDWVEEQAVEGANGLPAKTWTVSSSWVGKQLQARVSYTDAFGAQTASSSYSSTVTAAPRTNTDGSVSLSPDPPRAGSRLTATLSDPDTPITGLRWRLSITTASGTADEELVLESEVEGANGSLSYTWPVGSSMVGKKLRARASYTDAFGAQTASRLSSTVVAASGTAQDEDEDEPAEETEDEEPETETAEVPDEDESDEEDQTAAGQGEGEQTEGEDEQTAEAPAEDEQTAAGEGDQTEEAPAAKVALPDAALAARAAPNPFNPTTTLHVQLPASGPVRLTLYNVAGQVVHTLVDTALEAGYHTFYWDGRDQHGHPVTSGVYLYRLVAGPHIVVGKMALIR